MPSPIPFSRYADAPEDNGVRMPADELAANIENTVISELLGRLETFTSGKEGAAAFPWAARFAMGYPLPRWQRQLKWSPEQKVTFIFSIWSGVDVGTYMVNNAYAFEADGTFRALSEVLLDGQQRLTALEEYVTNQFPVPDVNGVPRYWRELSRIERRRFGQFHFCKSTVSSWDEEKLIHAYNLRAFGGTPHEESERASLAAK